MSRKRDLFHSIRAEGALLPPDILQRIAAFKVDSVAPASYHLPPGTKLNEAIAQSWGALQKHWKTFKEQREALADEKTGTGMTTEHWLLPLFAQLGYGRLTTRKAPEIDGRTYPIERFYSEQPIHLIGCNLELDKRTKGARGAATASPHSMMQEFLNRTEASLWGFLSNGLHLRILRDNISLSRQAYVEFDLESMMDGEVYGDFALLWLLCHQSRIEAEKPHDCVLEQWSQLARDDGTRVLSELRTGVERAIEALGQGFIAHPRNDRLREKLQSGTLDKQDYYRQILRLVYRMLFLFVAEDRKLLHPTDADPGACELYDSYYSMRRLRELSYTIRGSKHADLWHTLSLVFTKLGTEAGCTELGVTALGSFLWRLDSTADLCAPSPKGEAAIEEPVLIRNDDLLAAVRALAYVEQDRVLRNIDYRNMGSEELGSVYESLLELHPDMNIPGRTFSLNIAAGSERKTTGSYYTPDSLVQCLLDSALDPVLKERLKGKKGQEAEDAILSMTVCDPACGSGHFLIAAAHRLARKLSSIRTGESEPPPEEYQHALRDVIGRCIYGVDINPMAVELCKVSLWIEAIEPGKPLSFLDSHIQCGNSLLGTTPKLLADGIPDDAFKPIEGDEKKVASDLKKQNKKERKDRERGQTQLFKPLIKLGNLPGAFAELASGSDDSVADITEKEQLYAKLVSGSSYKSARLLADTWCSTFVWKKDSSDLGKHCPTEQDFRGIEENPHSILPYVEEEVRRLAGQYQFFHWHLAFPDVFTLPEDGAAENEQTGWNAGFDVVLGNPPWERVKLQEKEWFSERVPEIANAPNAAARKKLIKALETEQPALWKAFLKDARLAEGISHILRDSDAYPLCGRGDVNLYTVFAELFRNRLQPSGRFGAVLPSGIATDDTTKYYFQSLVETNSLISFYDFENKNIFPEVHSSMKFCLLTAGSEIVPAADAADFAFFCHSTSELNEAGKRFSLSPDDIEQLNPNTRTCPIFRSTADAELTKAIYRRVPVLIREARDGQPEENPWGIKFSTMFHMTNDSGLFRTREQLEGDGYSLDGNVFRKTNDIDFLPLYEAKMVGYYDHRAADVVLSATATIRQGQPEELNRSDHEQPSRLPMPRCWVSSNEVAPRWLSENNWTLSLRDVTSATNERTVIGAIVPRVGVGNNLPLLFTEEVTPAQQSILNGVFASLALDFAARFKVGGLHLNFFIVNQFPVLTPHQVNTHEEFLRAGTLELTYTAWDLEAFALDCGYDGPPFRWDEERRFLLRCELDAAYFHLYLGSPAEWGADSEELKKMFPTPRDAVEYIMETFPIVKKKDIKRTAVKDDAGEVSTEGTYITKDTILGIYDEMQQAMDTGEPYQTKLDPPPGPPADADGNFIPMAQWNEANWPEHVHESKNVTAK